LPRQQLIGRYVARFVLELKIEFATLIPRPHDVPVGLDRLTRSQWIMELAPLFRVYSAATATEVSRDQKRVVHQPHPRRRDLILLARGRILWIFPRKRLRERAYLLGRYGIKNRPKFHPRADRFGRDLNSMFGRHGPTDTSTAARLCHTADGSGAENSDGRATRWTALSSKLAVADGRCGVALAARRLG
jgi:hypothetical protein